MGNVSVPELSNWPRYRVARANNYTADLIILAVSYVDDLESDRFESEATIYRTEETTVVNAYRDVLRFLDFH